MMNVFDKTLEEKWHLHMISSNQIYNWASDLHSAEGCLKLEDGTKAFLLRHGMVVAVFSQWTACMASALTSSAFCLMQDCLLPYTCNVTPLPKKFEDIINRSTWYGVDVNVPLNSWERYHWCKSHCNAPIGKGVWPRCCNGCLSSLVNVHHSSLIPSPPCPYL